MKKKDEITLCYLCGKELIDDDVINRDHVPPRQFYPEEYRKEKSYNFVTLQVHQECNQSYQPDEDYFVQTLLPLCFGSEAGDLLLEKARRNYAKGRNHLLMHKVYDEFDERPGGIILPPNLIKKNLDSERVHRILWKIVRGLYFHHFKKALSENAWSRINLVPPGEAPPEHFCFLADTPFLGEDDEVFDYRYKYFPDYINLQVCHYWAMLFWRTYIFIVRFRYP